MEKNIPQEQAITTIDKNIAVNAGAGTGKTRVLTERYIEILKNGRLEEDKEIEGIVAITFTKKAAQEMVDRIRQEIRKNFAKGPEWSKYYRDMEKSNISTIHSFCANILRENPIEARVDPMFEVLEDHTSVRLLKDSIREILSEGLVDNDRVYKFLRILGKNTLDDLIEDFYQLYNMIRAVGMSFQEVRDKSLEYLGGLEVEERDLSYIKESFAYLMENTSQRSKFNKIKDNPLWIDFVEGVYREEDIADILALISDNIGSAKKYEDEIFFLTERLDKVMTAMEKQNIWAYEIILDLIIEIDKLYTLKKSQVGGLDYDDLQIITSKLLDNERVKRKYQKRYKYIMVDEYQDTNELQKNIIYKLVSDKIKLDRSNLFIVGDPKQSIYGFRGADIDVFYEVVEDIKKESEDKVITLEKNYRTVGTVLKFINNIFEKVMKNKYDSLSEFWQSDNQIDVEILENPDLEIPKGEKEANYTRQYEADLIAKRIRQLVGEGRFDYGDFAILFRSTTRDHIYQEALRNFNIPYYNTGGKRYFLQQEVKDMMNAIKSISNPFDTISTIGFLRSPMINLKDTSIYWILKERTTTVYNSMKKVRDHSYLEESEREKIIETIDLFESFYRTRDRYSLSELVEKIIKKTYFIESTLLREGGKQAIANIYKFKDLVDDFERKHGGTLEDFIDYLEEARTRDESPGKIESENANVVKILTIHKSKGLQFPVVIIPEMSTRPGGQSSGILFNKDIGLGLRLSNGRALYDNIRKDLIRKEEEERERILYVAMTRAEKMLILGNQGRNQGFKKLISNIIDQEEVRLVSEIDLEPAGYTKVKLIEEDLLNYNDHTDVEVPLLYDLKGQNKKTLERYSVSQYLTYKDCNRKFYLDYYKRIAGEINFETELEDNPSEEYLISPLEKGNIIHKFCEEYRLDLDKDLLIEDICNSFGVSYNVEIEEELKPYIDNYLKQYDEDQDKVYIEKEFHLKVGDNFITGIIDRINVKNKRVEIIDYKTNKIRNKSKLIEGYTPQLQLYAYVVKEAMGLDLKRARISFLEKGDYADIPIGEKDLEDNLSKIKAFMDFVSENDNIFDYKKSKKCNDYCKHKLICSLA